MSSPRPELAAVEFARLGITIERVLTDNGLVHRSLAYQATRKRAPRPPFQRYPIAVGARATVKKSAR